MGFMYLMQNFQTERLIAARRRRRRELHRRSSTTINYGRERVAFGKPIIKREVWQHKFVDLYTKLEAAKAFDYSVVDQYNDERYVKKEPLSMETVKLISMAKILVGDVVERGGGRVPPVPRRLGLHRGLPHRARVARPAPPPHRRRHDRDDEVLPREADGLLIARTVRPAVEPVGRPPGLSRKESEGDDVGRKILRDKRGGCCREAAPFPGAVAQLGERLTGSQKVMGSIPFSSTEDQ